MEQFFIFGGHGRHNAQGGFKDYKDQSSTYQGALEKCVPMTYDWYQIVKVEIDSETNECTHSIVFEKKPY